MAKLFRFIEHNSTLKRTPFDETKTIKEQIKDIFKLQKEFKFYPSKVDSEKGINEIDVNQLAGVLNVIDSKILYLETKELKEEKSRFATTKDERMRTNLCTHGDNTICINCVKKDVWTPELYKQRKNIPYLALHERKIKTKKSIKSEVEEYINALYNEIINKIPMCDCDKSTLEFQNIYNKCTKTPKQGNRKKCMKCIKTYTIKPQSYRYIDHVTFDYNIPDMYFKQLEIKNQIEKESITFGILIGTYAEFDSTTFNKNNKEVINTGTLANVETIYFPDCNIFKNAIDFHTEVSKKSLKKTYKCICGNHKSYFTNRKDFKLSFFETLKLLEPVLRNSNKNIIGIIYNRNTNQFTPQEMEFIVEMQRYFSITQEELNKEYKRRQRKNNKEVYSKSIEKQFLQKNKNDKKDEMNGSLFITCILEPIDTSYEINAYQMSDLLTESLEAGILAPSQSSFISRKEYTTFTLEKDSKICKTKDTKSLEIEYFLISIPTGSKKIENNIFNNEIIHSHKLFEIKKYLKNFTVKKFFNINFLVYLLKLNCKCQVLLEDPSYYNIIVSDKYLTLKGETNETKFIDYNLFIKRLFEGDSEFVEKVFKKYFNFLLNIKELDEEKGWHCKYCTFKNPENKNICEMCNCLND